MIVFNFFRFWANLTLSETKDCDFELTVVRGVGNFGKFWEFNTLNIL